MKAKITLSNIKGFLSAHYRQALDELGFLEEHIKEQAEWRLSQVKEKSPECYENDKCTHCGCQVSSKVFEDRACEGNCYPEMLSKEDWVEFKWNLEEDKCYSCPICKDVKVTNDGWACYSCEREQYMQDLKDYAKQYDDAPGIKGKSFKVNLNKENGTAVFIIMDLSKEETLEELMQNNPHLTKQELLYWCPKIKDK